MQQPIIKMKNKKGVRVIPGFSLTMGVTVTMLSCIVLIPLASLILSASKLNFSEFLSIVTSRQILSGYTVSLSCAFIASAINAFFGVLLAWVLVRYEFPGKRIMDGMIELPFALPTAVAGISLTSLYSDQGWIGSLFAKAGIKIAFTRIGITIAMIFIGIPFVVRAVQPVLEKMDREYEEAAMMLGASRIRTFFKVILPELFPSILAGFGLAFARGIGEYGSVVFIAGNIPYKTQIAPLLIMSKLEQYKYSDATAIALVLLLISFLLMFLINSVQIYMQRFSKC
ncbi:MAG: sulfate ABC transporter permease subunit CysT [Lachnospiraceae bacterium]|nr:sulfate ABC transporter permease subunit CysT [Lachnospiraceae bacterium]